MWFSTHARLRGAVIYIYVCVCVYIYMCVCVYIYICVCVYIRERDVAQR